MPSWGLRLCCGILIMLSTARLCAAEYKVCPPEFETSVQETFGDSNYLQKSVWQRIPCLSFRREEALDGVIWYRGSNINDPSKIRLISRDLRGDGVKDNPSSARYSFSPDSSLVIKGVEESDEGRYICQVIPQITGSRVEKIDVQVIGETFPAHASDKSSTTSFQRGRRQMLPCQCAAETPVAHISAVYWSRGEGVTEHTTIIGVRFSDDAFVQIQDHADYTISSNASLIVYFPTDGIGNQRFWCHVFMSNNTQSHCHIDVRWLDEQKPDTALKASESSFYLLEGEEQSIPCLSFTGSSVCEIEWFKIDSAGQNLLASRNEFNADSNFDLANDYGLVIKSVDASHAGRYRCRADQGLSEETSVYVIGDKFQLDGSKVFVYSTIDYVVGKNNTLTCSGASNATEIQGGTTIIWSFGTPTEQTTTTVIGRLALPERSKVMSGAGDKACYNISPEGSLLLNNCSQYGDVRYWCHVFFEHGLLITSYVDVLSNEPEAAGEFPIAVIVFVSGGLVALIAIALICRKMRSSHSTMMETKCKLEVLFGPLEQDVRNFVHRRKDTIQMLQETADHLTEVHREAEKAKRGSGVAGLAVTALAITGVAASFFTFGTSLYLAAAAAALDATSGALMVAGQFVQVKSSKDAEKKVKKILKDDSEAMEKVEHRLEEIESDINEFSSRGQVALKTASSVFEFVRVGRVAVSAGKSVGQSASKVAFTFGKGLAIGSALLSFVSVPLDLHTVITCSENLKNNTIPELAKSINELVTKLTEDCPQEQDIEVVINDMRVKFCAPSKQKTNCCKCLC